MSFFLKVLSFFKPSSFFDIQSLLGLPNKDLYSFIKEKTKKEDSDFNEFLTGLEKNVTAACNQYRQSIEKRYYYEINISELNDEIIHNHIASKLKRDMPVKLKELPLPPNNKMPFVEKQLFFSMLEEHLRHSFEYFARNGINRILEDTAEIKEKIDDLKNITQSKTTEPRQNHFLTTPPTKVGKEFLHRDKFVDNLCKAVKEKNKILLVNGLGGIGKTTIARALFHRLEGNYTYVAWVEYNENLKESMLSAIDLFNNKNMHDYIREPDERYKQIKKFIQENKDTLIIVDNVSKTTMKDNELKWLETMKNTVILTSRIKKIGAFEIYPVDFLNPDECLDVFYGYYEEDCKKKFVDTVKKLVELAKYHTLTVELLAKAANRPGTILNDFYKGLVEKGFGYPDLPVETQHTQKELKPAEHIKILYDFVDISPEQENILKNFAIMPSIEIPFEVETWLGANIKDLTVLVNLGWLSRTDNGYYMHPIIKESMLMKLEVKFSDCETIISYMVYDDYIKATDVFSKVRVLLDIAKAFYTKFANEELKVFYDFSVRIGLVCKNQGDYEEALKSYNKALVVCEKINGTEHSDTAMIYNNIGVIYQYQGNYEEALKFYNKALAVKEKVYGTEHPDTATTYNNIGIIHRYQSNYEEALKFYNKALTVKEKAYGTEHTSTASTYNNIGVIYQYQGNYEEALKFYNKAMAVYEKVCGTEHPDTAMTYNNIGLVYDDKGNYEEALKFYNKAMAVYEKVCGTEHPDTAMTYNNIGVVYEDLENYPKGLEWYQKALDIRKKILGIEHPETKKTINNIANLKKKM